MHKNRITCVVLIGIIPPPFGGVSVHVNRLAHHLISSGIECHIISSCNSTEIINGVNVIHAKSKYHVILQCIKLLQKKPIYHFHTMWNDGVCKLLLKLMGQRIVSTIHDTMVYDKYVVSSRYRRFLSKFVIKLKSEKYIAVNKRIQQILERMGAPLEDISVIPAFLPETRQLVDDIPISVKEYIEKQDSVILVYGWKVSFDKDGSDIYGFHTALEVYAELLKNKSATAMIFLVPGGDLDKYIEDFAKTMKVADKYYLHTEPIRNMAKLLLSTSVYFRPSTTDGDSVLVREALAAGVTVVASSVVERPVGVVEIDNKISGYVKAIEESIIGEKQKPLEENCYDRIIEVYDTSGKNRVSLRSTQEEKA